MEKLVVGSVVVTSFPFSNLRAHKNRPALVLGFGDFNDVILCQITSVADGRLQKVCLRKDSFATGGLPTAVSYARPDKLFTADQSIITKNIGLLKPAKIQEIKHVLKDILGH